MRNFIILFAFVLLLLLETSCATIKSKLIAVDLNSKDSAETYYNNVNGQNGLIYHLPLKDVKLSVNVADDPKNKSGKIYTPNVESGDAYPDLSSSFLLTISKNEFGSNSLSIQVSPSGLLSTAKSTSISEVDNIAQGLASVGGSMAPLAVNVPVAGDKASTECPLNGTYTKFISVQKLNSDGDELCEYKFSVAPKIFIAESGLMSAAMCPEKTKGSLAKVCSAKSYSGIYYRQEVPIYIEASPVGKDSSIKSFMVLVPMPNTFNKLDVPRNLFADNTTAITLTDGMPKEYDPQKNSEVLGVLKIPADVIGAYFKAFGQFFDSFASAKKSEAQASEDAAYLQLQKSNTQLCLKALASNDPVSIKASCPSGP